MKYEPMTKPGPFRLRHQSHQVKLDFDGIDMTCQPQPSAEPTDVSVHGDARRVEGVAEYHISRFPAHAGQGGQLLQL